MSDGAVKLEEEGSPTDGVKRAGRARFCKQCRFTTTDVREFSNHRLHAHAEDNTEEKNQHRRNNVRRKSSAVSVTQEEQTTKEEVLDLKGKSEIKVDVKEETDIPEEKLETKTEQTMAEITTEQTVANEQEPISNELLNSLLLAPRKVVDSIKTENNMNSKADEAKRPVMEKIVLEKINGHKEEILLVNKDDEGDDEPRLVIADDFENGDDNLDLNGSDPVALCRSGNIQNRTYLCSSCDFSTTNAKSYLHHQKDCHNSDIVIYECDICDYATKYKQKLPRHRKLHFMGKDGCTESDLDNSLTEKELKEMRDHTSINNDIINGEEEMDEDVEMEEDEEEEALISEVPDTSITNTPDGAAPVEKKKRIRQEVDPLKYYEVMDEVGVKYACSKCGNVYKWRKSLNKHWKEKHFGETPDLTKPPATLQNYTLFSRFKAKLGGAPPPPAAPNVVYGAAVPSPTAHVKQQRSTPTSKPEDESHSHSTVVMPRQIGPFIAGTTPNMLNPAVSQAGLLKAAMRAPENHHELRQMMELQSKSRPDQNRSTPKSSQLYQQSEPLDFSKPLDFSRKLEIKQEAMDTNSENDSLQEMPMSLVISQVKGNVKEEFSGASDQDNPVLQCNKCSYVAKTLVDYSAHMSLHLNKRAFKCAECQAHFNGVDDLNRHFLEAHSEKIQEHKEAIQKIPHGLQQTYHLLKMPLENISSFSSQELMSNEPKQLKCSMCQFVAKWPAELQKHAVSHSEERPFVCMVCGSTYKWKWDLVKHFEKSHSTLPNPYKRRDNGGVISTTVNSPSTPPLESISKTASALMDAGMIGANYILDDEIQRSKKRRLSETDLQDGDEYYRELLEKQIRKRREMTNSETPSPVEGMWGIKRPNSEPTWSSSGELDSEEEKMRIEERVLAGSTDLSTPKRDITEALKQRINSMKQGSDDERKTPGKDGGKGGVKGSDVVLPYKCSVCDYRARWPSEISQHMKNHSNEKPFHCPRCSYKSKWKWDVVKHLRRCGGGTVHDVIDTTKIKKMAPPNVMVLPQGNLQQHQQQQQQQVLTQSQKKFSSQPVFPSSQVSPSMASSSVSGTRIPTPNFAMSAGGQDHPDSLDLSQTTTPTQQQSSTASKQPIFRGIVNQGMYHCLECPFVGLTQAELRRHSVLHSENKPFMCNMCGYSSRWKCDLKKHMKIYGHYSSALDTSSDGDVDTPQDKYVELEDESDEENKSTLYMCPQCPYNSYKKQAYDHHLKIHGNLMGDSPDVPFTDKSSSSKYKCSKCSYHGNDLSSFLQHKRCHQDNEVSPKHNSMEEASGVSPVPDPSVVSNRTLHLKHRRKPLKQFRCKKCPYVCFRRVALTNHELMHASRSTDAYLCMFCDYNVFSKSLLLQHMRLHPQYNPAECSDLDLRVSATELMEMEELEEKEMNIEERNDPSMLEENNNIGDYESGFDGRDSLSPYERMSTPVEDKKPVTNNNTTPTNNNITNNKSNSSGLPCEWCSATFPNVVTLYQHAQTLHPLQLKAQEAGDIAARQAPSKSSQLEQIVRERQREYQVYHQFMSQQQQQLQSHIQAQTQNQNRRYVPLAPKPYQSILPQVSPSRTATSSGPSKNDKQVTDQGQDKLSQSHLNPNMIVALRARKSTSQQRRARSFQCTKCSFTAPNAVTYLRHIERHGSNCKHTCLYCDYSIDRLNLLYQHMKGTHGSQWQGTTEEKINLSVHTEDTNNNIIENLNFTEDNSMSEDLNASSSSSHNDSLEGETELKQVNDDGALSAYSAKGIKPVLTIQEESSWRGTNLQICTLDGRKHYKCPKCFYISSNAANCSIHVRQHGQNRKYKCNQCDYGVDNFKHMQNHVDNIHPKEPNFILKTATEQQPRQVQENLEDSEMTSAEIEALMSVRDTKQEPMMSCPKCPFKTSENEKYQVHLNRHRVQGKYECQLCDYSVDKYKYLRQHAQLHSSNQQLTSSTSAADMVDSEDRSVDESGAMDAEMDENSNDRLRFRCSCCPYITLVRQDILKHRLCHIQKKALACQLCTYSADQADDLNDHMKLHQGSPVRPAKGFHDVTMDPYNDSYKLIEQLPDDDDDDDDDEEEMDVEEDVNANESRREFEEVDEFDGLGDDDAEDDVEMALMEEELRDSIALTGESKPKNFGRNLNDEGAFDSDLQFRNYKCQDCPYSSNSNGEYRKHCRLHGTCYKFKCDFCNYSLDRVNLISQHRKLHFQEPGFEVAPLMAKLLNKDHEEHEVMLQKVGKEVAYPPTESSSKIPEYAADYSYLLQRGVDGMDEKVRYSCNKCPYKCQALKSFKCHIQLHGLMRKYKCDYCDWSADRLNLLYQHRKVHANESGFDPAPGDIVFLNREFLLDGDNVGGGTVGMAMMEFVENPFAGDLGQTLQPIKKTSSGQKVFSCKMCPFKTDSVNTYSYHKKLHCLQARYKCSECTYSINNLTSLKEHIKLHKKEREMIRSTISESMGSYKCPKCPYSSPNKNLLVTHTAMHSSGRKYECNQCDFSADKQQLLDFHMKVHDENYSDSNSQEEMELLMKKGPDIIGPQLYFSSPNLQEMDTDSNSSADAEQKCEKCPFSTPSKEELGSHLQHHEMHCKVMCMYCTYSCSKDEELLKHVQVHFPSTPVDKDLLKILKRQNLNYRKNFSKNGDREESGVQVEEHKEPDSTVNENIKEETVEKVDQQQVQKDSGKTKVYVCQYCEREFDCKASMLQHEKQHLVGS